MATLRPTVDTVLFRPVKVGRASEDVVRQIKNAIHTGQIRPGDALPSERELTVHLGVSRVTVRDALRTLEATGLVRIRVGARGGAFVTAPEPGYVGEGRRRRRPHVRRVPHPTGRVGSQTRRSR